MLSKNNTGGVVVSFVYLLLFFMYKYTSDLFMDFWQIDTLTQKINIGDITITQGFVASILISILVDLIYNVLSVKKILDPVFKYTIFRDRD